jgi:hypothetical protein
MSDEVLSFSELAQSVKPGEYRHFKGGMYTVLGIARHSEDHSQEFVVYKAHKTGDLWVRPLSMFVEQVQRDGYKGPRFEYIETKT